MESHCRLWVSVAPTALAGLKGFNAIRYQTFDQCPDAYI